MHFLLTHETVSFAKGNMISKTELPYQFLLLWMNRARPVRANIQVIPTQAFTTVAGLLRVT